MKPDSKLPHVGTTIFSVMSQLAAQHQAINLSQGFPDFAAPPYLLQQLAVHANAGRNQYAPMAGIPELREQIRALIARCYEREVSTDTDIALTSGATEALFVAIQTLVRPGDEVILFDPAYDSYEPAVTLAGGRCRRLPLLPPDYAPDWQQVADTVNARTRCIIVNSPHNPTSRVFTEADWRALESLAEQHGLWVISDEVYEHIVFDERPRLSAHCFDALAQRCYAISSFGKTFHTTGWKLGYCVAPAAMMGEFQKIHQYVTFASFTPAQYAVADMLAQEPEHVAELGRFYQRKRDIFVEAMRDSRFRLLPSGGSYFVLADYSAIRDEPDLDFCRWLTEHGGVAAIPLSVFYESPPDTRIVRFCFAKQDGTLLAAAEKLWNL